MAIGIDSPDGVELNTDVLYEKSFPLTEVKKQEDVFSMMGEPMPVTLRRLSKKGRLSPITGQYVRLEVAVGATGQLYPSVQACRRFIERLNGKL